MTHKEYLEILIDHADYYAPETGAWSKEHAALTYAVRCVELMPEVAKALKELYYDQNGPLTEPMQQAQAALAKVRELMEGKS